MKKFAYIATVIGALIVVGVGPAGVAEAADTSPSCPTAYECLQSGPDPLVPYGTDPGAPYGVGAWNSPVPYGRGSGSYTGGAS